MFTKNIWHNCAHFAGPALCCCLWRDRADFLFDLMNPGRIGLMNSFCSEAWDLDAAMQETQWSLLWSWVTHGGLIMIHDHWYYHRLHVQFSEGKVVQLPGSRCSPLYTCTVQLYTRPARTGRGRAVHRAQSCRTVPAVRSDQSKEWVFRGI